MPSTLRSHRLRRIIGAYTVNRLGTWFGFVALSVAVFDHTHSAVAVAALLISGQALPAFAAPALAARVEASQRRGVLSGLYLFEGVVTTLLAVLLWHFWLPAILILAALDGTAALAASALLRAETARAAREQAEVEWDAARGKDLESFTQAAERQANATLNIAFSATFMLGPAIAGVLVAAAGAPAALFIDAASFLICGGMLLDLSAHAEDAGTLRCASGCALRGRTSTRCRYCAPCCLRRRSRWCSSTPPARSRSRMPKTPCTPAIAAMECCSELGGWAW